MTELQVIRAAMECLIVWALHISSSIEHDGKLISKD
jgi:hypothetical protein